jgi:hypothetical protein
MRLFGPLFLSGPLFSIDGIQTFHEYLINYLCQCVRERAHVRVCLCVVVCVCVIITSPPL